MSLFLFLFSISLRQYCPESLAKNGGFGKYLIKKGDGHNRGSCLRKGGFNLSAYCNIERLNVGTFEP